MRTIYVNNESKCHTLNNGTMIAVETDRFDGMCDEFISGYCCEIREGSIMFYPWKPYNELNMAQRKYEQAQLAEYKAELAELDAALLDAQYQNIIGGM